MTQLDPSIPLNAMGANPQQPQQQMSNALQVFQMKDAMQQRGQQQQAQQNERRMAKKVESLANRGTGLFLKYRSLIDDAKLTHTAAEAAMQEDFKREIGGLASERDDNGMPLYTQEELQGLGQEFKAGELGQILPKLMGAKNAMDMYFKQQELAVTKGKTEREQRRMDLDSQRLALDSRKADEAERSNRATEAIRAKAVGGGSQIIENEDGTQTIVPAPGKRTPIPSEIQARMALGENYAKQVPDLLAAIEEGKSGALGTAFNVGTSGLLAKRQESGVDALVRNLTGAGKSKEEAESYASRYQFEATDTDARKKEKVLQLVSELKAIDSATKTGRGWPASSAYEGIPEPKPLSGGAPTDAHAKKVQELLNKYGRK